MNTMQEEVRPDSRKLARTAFAGGVAGCALLMAASAAAQPVDAPPFPQPPPIADEPTPDTPTDTATAENAEDTSTASPKPVDAGAKATTAEPPPTLPAPPPLTEPQRAPFWGPTESIPKSSNTHRATSTDKAAWTPHIDVHADMLNFFLFRNDADFDRSRPFYDENGQTVGAFATLFRPMATFHATPTLRLYYEAELGLNYWSKNNPDQEDPLADDVFVLKHRQVYAEGELADGDVGFKVGYQFFSDPTELFIGHWIGAATAHYNLGSDNRLGVFVGQVPDQTYEGITVEQNNFKRDIFVFGPRADFQLAKDIKLNAAIVGLHDAHLVERTRWLVAPALHVEGTFGDITASVDGVVQLGTEEQAALGNEDQRIFAWALQGHGTANLTPITVDLNALVLSSDDSKDGNKNNGTFVYSSRSRSATLMLTEDELRNWYDQFDRRAGAYRGGFWEHRAGLAVVDVKGSWEVTKVFHPGLVVGGAMVLQKHNALENRFVGFESDVDLEFRASDNLSAHIAAGAMIPGKAASALINNIDRDATDPIYMLETSLLARY